MESFLIRVLEKVMEPMAVLDKERKIIYCTNSFKALVGERDIKDRTCLDMFIPAFSMEGIACCWDVVYHYLKSKDCGFWVSKKDKKIMICNAYIIRINKDEAFVVVKLRELHCDSRKDSYFAHLDESFSLIRENDIESYKLYIRNIIRASLNVKSVNWISKEKEQNLYSLVSKILSMGYRIFDILWENKLFHVIGTQSPDNTILIRGLSDLSQKELIQILCALEFTNCKLEPKKPSLQGFNCLTALTKREKEILNLVLRGYSNQQISNELGISLNTVKNHIKNILSKTNTQRRAQLIAKYSAIYQL